MNLLAYEDRQRTFSSPFLLWWPHGHFTDNITHNSEADRILVYYYGILQILEWFNTPRAMRLYAARRPCIKKIET